MNTLNEEELSYDGNPLHKDPKRIYASIKLEDNLLNSTIGEYKLQRALEKAKRLSVNLPFQEKVDNFRKNWNITHRLPPENFSGESMFPENILKYYAFNAVPSEDEWQKLQSDLITNFCRPLKLDELHDYGLIVAAICYGLTPENILKHWDRIAITAAKEFSPGVTVIYHRELKEARTRIGPLAVIIYLFGRLHDVGIRMSSLPDPVREWVKLSLTTLQIKPSNVPAFIDRYECRPSDKLDDGIKLYLEITPETTYQDILRTWPQIKWHKYKLWGIQQNKLRQWRTYERDIFIWQNVKIDGLTIEKAFDLWLENHPDDVTEITAIKKGLNKIDNLSKIKELRI